MVVEKRPNPARPASSAVATVVERFSSASSGDVIDWSAVVVP